MEQINTNVMSNTKRKYKKTSDELRQLIVDRMNSGFSATVIGEMFSVNPNTVLQIYRKYQKTGQTSNGKGVQPKKLNVKRVTPLHEDVNTPEVTNGVPNIIINDILDELRDENNRLLNENKLILNLLEKYRKGLTDLHNICVYNETSNVNNIRLLPEFESLIKSLEKELSEVFQSNDNFNESHDKYEDNVNTEAIVINEIQINSSSDDTNDNDIDSEPNIEPKGQNPLNESLSQLNESVDQNEINDNQLESCSSDDNQYNDSDCDTDSDSDYKCVVKNIYNPNHTTKAKPEKDLKTCVEFSDQLNDSKDQEIERQPKISDKPKKIRRLRYNCDYEECGQQFKSPKNLENHIRVRHLSEKPFKCEECGKGFKSNPNLKCHLVSHSPKKQFQCKKCHKRFTRSSGLAIHVSATHAVNPTLYKCSKCAFIAKQSGQLRAHIKSRHTTREANIKCDFKDCEQTFDSNDTLLDHLKTIHGFEMPFKCKECDKSFYSLSKIQKHKSYHKTSAKEGCSTTKTDNTPVKPLKKERKAVPCDWPGCDYISKTNAGDVSHKRSHLAARVYVCTFEGCSKSFRTNKTLFVHKQSHIKKYVCSWPCCTERFSSNPLLTAHLRKHQNLRPFKCYIDGCVKNFYIKPHLDHHIRTVHKTKPIPSNSMQTFKKDL